MVSPGTHPDPMTGTTVWVPERRPVAVDPWDMPYFGATVYLRYQPALSPLPGTRIPVGSTAGDDATGQPPLRFAPWDAPYFGEAAVYFTYPAYPAVLAPLPSPGSDTAAGALTSPPLTAIATSAPASAPKERVADSGETHRRSWLSRLFGRN
jgi:hypothetical protein